ncbi:MAG: hypothetical protein U0X73_12205 [Thermoanaerobaculia bacterium]
MTIAQRAFDRLAADIEPAAGVAAAVAFDGQSGLPIWGFAHPDLELSIERPAVEVVSIGEAARSETRNALAGLLSQVAPASGGSERKIVISAIRLGETPKGFRTVLAAMDSAFAPGRDVVLLVVGDEPVFLRMAL